MMKSLAVGTLLLVAGTVSALPIGITNEKAPSMYETLERLVNERTGGDLSQLGVQTLYDGNGVVTEKVISGFEFLTLSKTALNLVDSGTNAASGDAGAGYGTNNPPQLATRLGWPFCDYSSAFVLYFGAAGTTLVKADRSPTGDVATSPVCGGFYGVTHTWSDITIDGSGTNNLFGPCIAAMVVGPLADRNVGVTGGYICSGPVVSSHGNSALTSLSFFGIALDYSLGQNAVTLAGSSQL